MDGLRSLLRSFGSLDSLDLRFWTATACFTACVAPFSLKILRRHLSSQSDSANSHFFVYFIAFSSYILYLFLAFGPQRVFIHIFCRLPVVSFSTMLGHQFAYSAAPLRKVKEVQFGILSPEEIVRLHIILAIFSSFWLFYSSKRSQTESLFGCASRTSRNFG